MNNRRAIYSLIAMGRLTPAQAERLLALANEHSETLLVLVACAAAVFLMQVHHRLVSEFLHHLQLLLPEGTTVLHQTQNIVNGLVGGLL